MPSTDRRQWRSLAEAAGGRPEPPEAPLPPELSRREVMRAMAASAALAGLAGCDEPPVGAVSYVTQPERIIPGKPLYYATAVLLDGYAQPVLGETHVGRPTKLEGNPDHPASGGATDAFTQAAVLQLYDPDRSRAVVCAGAAAGWDDFRDALAALARDLEATGGEGLRVLTGAFTSPTLARQLDEVTARFPRARWHAFDPVSRGLRTAAARLAVGRPLDLIYELDRAEVTVAFDEDLLGPGPAQVRHVRAWGANRRRAHPTGHGPRLLVVESAPTLTGAAANRRWAAPATRIPLQLAALAQELGTAAEPEALDLPPAERARIAELADELRRHRGRGLVCAGPTLPAEAQALALAVNDALGNLGATLRLVEPLAPIPPDGERSLGALAAAMAAGEVRALVILDTNPVYTAPADLGFAGLMDRVPLRVHLGLYRDETAELCHWHVPATHALESWSDARAVEGTATILQPLVQPIFQGRSAHQLLSVLLGRPEESPMEAVQETWRRVFPADAFEERWRRALHEGYVAGTGAEPVAAAPRAVPLRPPPASAGNEALELVFRPDPTVWDGSFANVAWLQELPKPLSKLTWENIAAVSPRLAAEMGLVNGDRVEIVDAGLAVTAPVWVQPGQAARTVTLYLGYGRWAAGRLGTGIGYDAYVLRRSGSPWLATGATLRRVGERAPLATTQEHHTMEGGEPVVTVTPAELAAAAESEPPRGRDHPTLYPEWDYPGYAWGMAIDLDLCVGCNACVVACQAENNVPVVGRREVLRHREMHWLRIDRYYEGAPEDPEILFQPVPCMHCEKAPCEMGCPVNATVHGPEGLNQMIYNRCIGTRTCAAYCPYEVRRFNFFHYAAEPRAAVAAVRNPDVTVRARGVMEKCTYCVQRINAARIEAKKEGRSIRDGEVETACQSACPSRAIVFGDLNDPDSAVSRARRSPRHYALLGHLNTRPRTTYLARLARGAAEPGS